MLADYLRTDGHRRHQLVDPGLQEIQPLVRLRDDQVRARSAAVKPAHGDLGRALAQSSPPVPVSGSPIAVAFLTDYPTPRSHASSRAYSSRAWSGRRAL